MKIAIIKISKAISKLSFTLGSISLTAGFILSMVHTPVLADAVDPGPPTTTLNVQPIGVPGNNDCENLIPAEDFLFQFKIEEPGLFGSFPLYHDGMSGTLDVVGGSNELGQAFDFSFSGDFITAAIGVKGGPDTNYYDYRPLGGAAADTYLHSPVNPQSELFYDISHISFCIVAAPEPPTPTPTQTPTNTPTTTPTNTPTATSTYTPTFTPTLPTEEPSPTPTQTEQPPSPIIDTPTPTAEEPQPSPEPTFTQPPPGPPPVTATSTPTEEQPQVTPEPTSTQPPTTPPGVTPTNTAPATLVAPTQPATTPILIPVTGVDFDGSHSELLQLQQLLINMGLGLLGLALAFYGISYKFNRT
jgi:hypothetical protein